MNKTMLVAALAALAVGSASADTIYITGSTAFRSAANTAISNAVVGKGGSLVARDTSDVKAGNMVFKADSSNTNFVVVYWSGSEAGIQSVAGPSELTYRPSYNTFTTNFATNATGPAGYTRVGAANGANTVWKQIVTNPVTNSIATQPNKLPFWDATQTFDVDSDKKIKSSYTATKVQAVADIAFSDTYQASSAFLANRTVPFYDTNNLDRSVTSPVSQAGIKVLAQRNVLCASNNYSAISSDYLVGAVSFGFIVSPNAAAVSGTNYAATNAGIANITKAQAKDLFQKGKVNAAQFTGSLDDTNRFVYAVGRGIDSGTRLVTFSMLGLGNTVTNNSLTNGVQAGINQYLVLGNVAGVDKANTRSGCSGTVFVCADGVTITNNDSTLLITNFPADVTVGKLCATGHNGYYGGGEMCTTIAAVTKASSPSNAIVIGYAGLNDAAGKNNNILAYEGVYPSTGAIKSGSYPFWSMEHLLVRNSSPTNVTDLATNLVSRITANDTIALQTYGKGLLSVADITNNLTRGSTNWSASVDGGTISKLWTNAANTNVYFAATNLPSYSTASKQGNAGAGIGF